MKNAAASSYKNNHYVPIVLQMGWARELDGQAHSLAETYALVNGQVMPPVKGGMSMKRIASGSWLYLMESGEREENLEASYFLGVDDKGAKVLNGLREGYLHLRSLSGQQQTDLWRFVVSLRARHPLQMTASYESYKAPNSKLGSMFGEGPDADRLNAEFVSKSDRAHFSNGSVMMVGAQVETHWRLLKEHAYIGLRDIESPLFLMSNNPIPRLSEEKVSLLPISRTKVLAISRDYDSILECLQLREGLLAKAANLGVMRRSTVVLSTGVDVSSSFIEKRIGWGDRLSAEERVDLEKSLQQQISSENLSFPLFDVVGPVSNLELLRGIDDFQSRNSCRFPSSYRPKESP